METAFTIIHADGTEEQRTVDLPSIPDYEQIKAVVEPIIGAGVYFERINVLHDGRYTDMFVDEEGLLKGLPRNEKATAIYRANWLAQRPGTPPEAIAFTVGTAVLFSRRIWF